MGHFFFIVSALNLDAQTWQTLFEVFWLVLIIVVPPTLVPLLFHTLQKPGKRLSYRTESDVALVNQRKDLGEDMVVTVKGGALEEPTGVDNARLIMFKLINTGSKIIRREDFSFDEQYKLRFEFDEPKLILGSVHHTEPDDLIPLEERQDMIKLDPTPPDEHVAPSDEDRPFWRMLLRGNKEVPESRPQAPARFHKYVDMDGCTLGKNEAVVLKFVTRGHVPMRIQGRLLGGQIVPYTPPQPIFIVTRLLLGFLITIICIAGFMTFSTFHRNNCALGFYTINAGGSSAFYATAENLAVRYHQGCVLTTVNVQASDSDQGQVLLALNHLDIANTELPCTQHSGLTGNRVAGIVFAVIVNQQVTGVHSLTRNQLTEIYEGQITNWRQVGGPDLSIILYGRPVGSGTMEAFNSKVLLPKAYQSFNRTILATTQEVLSDVANTKGAIGYVDLEDAMQNGNVSVINIDDVAPSQNTVENGKYPFWATEYMCTRNNNSNDAAATAFIDYVTDHIVTNDAILRVSDIPSSTTAGHS